MLAALPAVASALAICVGTLVLAGWTFDVEALKRMLPGFVAMNPATALFFIILGVALALAMRTGENPAFQRVVTAGAVVVLIGATLKVLGLALNWHPTIDEILFAGKLATTETKMPNRMAPNTAVNFGLASLSLLTLDLSKKRFPVSQTFALLAGLGALLPLTGYAYGVRSFQGLAAFIPMAVHTAITFLTLAAGLFFARSTAPLAQIFATNDSRGVIARRLFPFAILVTLVLGWLRLAGERRGLYEAAFGTAAFAIALSVIFVVLVSWTVWTIGKVEGERKVMNDALVESKWQLQGSLRQTELIINHARELICTLDAQEKIISVNSACDEILAIASPEWLGRSFFEVHSPAERPRIETALHEAKCGLSAAAFSASCRKRDESFAAMSWSIRWSPHYQKMYCVGRTH